MALPPPDTNFNEGDSNHNNPNTDMLDTLNNYRADEEEYLESISQNLQRTIVGVDREIDFRPPSTSSTPALNSSDLQEEKELYQASKDTHIKEGETWCLISARWFEKWKGYLRGEGPRPGPIDNATLLDSAGILLKTSSENLDFTVARKDIWDKLFSWYTGGPEVPRLAISPSSINGRPIIEYHLLCIRFIKSSDYRSYVTEYFSKASTVGEVKLRLCEKFRLDPARVRVWDYYSVSYMKVLNDLDMRLDSAQIIDDQYVLLEEQNPDLTWPTNVHSRNYCYDQVATPPGQTGLSNLGNTCFMNSALQCLSNTLPVRRYFLSGAYRKDINDTNPLGMKGELAEEFAQLLLNIWAGTHSTVAPRDFKYKLEKFAPQFAGYQQQDAQELLAFLLDGLHEDLNRVREKPYSEPKDTEARPDSEVAAEAWTLHLSRNNSVFVEWFQGQYKSTLVCPECNKVSITFDPFMYLSVPIPQKTTRQIPVTFFRIPEENGIFPKPINYSVTVPILGNIGNLKEAIAITARVDTTKSSLAVAEVYNSVFFRQYDDDSVRLESIQDRDDICAYELRKDESSRNDVLVNVVLRFEDKQYYHGGFSLRRMSFGIPRIIQVSVKQTLEDLYKFFLRMLFHNLNLEDLPSRERGFLPSIPGEEGVYGSSFHNHPRLDHDMMRDDAAYDSEQDDDDDEDAYHAPDENNKENSRRKTQNVDGVRNLFKMSLIDSENYSREGDMLTDIVQLRDCKTLTLTWKSDTYNKCYSELTSEPHMLDSQETDADEEKCTLRQCLELFTSTERLGPDDPWYCNKCQEFRQATKKFDLWKLPPILVVHLKRFSYQGRFGRERLDTLVDFPIEGLDLTRHVINPDCPEQYCVYDLFAVSNHIGSTYSGHYTAYAKDEAGQWLCYDDRNVAQMTTNKIRSSASYVLFYQRRGASFPSAESSVEGQSQDPQSATESSSLDNL